jgi:peptide/nickel transport system substrate-binding protein
MTPRACPVIVAILAVTLLLPRIAWAQPAPPATSGGSLRFATPADPDGLDPHRSPADSTFNITMNIFDTLVATNSKGEILPGLATKWYISTNGLLYAFTLRQGVAFHNGKPFTSADVKYSLQRMSEKSKSPHAADYAIIDSVEAPDPMTLRLALKRPSARFLSDLAYGWAAMVP